MGEVEERGNKLKGAHTFHLLDKVKDGKIYVDQGIIAGCAGGMYENIAEAAEILKGKSCGNGEFSLSVYPQSQPVFKCLVDNGYISTLMGAGAIVKTAFCGPASARATPLPTTASPSATPPATLKTGKVPNLAKASFRPLRLWTRAR